MKSEKNASPKSSEFWGICCEGGKKYSQVVCKRFHITMAALDPTVVPTSPVVSLMVDRGGCEYLLCSLKPSTLLQVNLNLYFDKGEKVTFFLKGSGKIHLSGYHILEENQRIQNKSIDKTISKQKNKSNSVQKIEVDDDEESPLDEEESESSEDDELSEEIKDLKKDSNKLKNYKRLWSSLTQNDEEESESSDEDEEEEVKEISKKRGKDFQEKKKLKTDTSTPVLNKKLTQNILAKSNKFDKASTLEKTPKSNDNMNSSIGRTPMPQKKTPKVNQANLSPKKVNFADSNESSDSDEEVKSPSNIMSPSKSPSNIMSPIKSEESSSNKEAIKKKKKKKKKAKDSLNTSDKESDNIGKKVEAGLASASYSQKLPGGLEFEDVRVGNGPVAKKGKLVHVYYTGMLSNNKEFDSRKPGTKPFSFKLGADQVIKGWDIGIEGMKVGGKRRLKIPSNLGYKNERMGPIPPMSTLYFTVELKAVS